MNRQFAIVAIVGVLVLGSGCSDDKSSDSTTPATISTDTTTTIAAPTEQTIAGTISYAGDLGPGVILVVANLVGSNGPPLYSAVLGAAGSYAITGVADGEYILFAFVDAANDRGAPEEGEAQGFYDTNGDGNPDPVVIAGGAGVIDIDMTLV
ncbi:MAG: hypothetical protein HY826_05260 [Actinobacteria bacterium]|nr:hypothetical protein [Actinomycetota bacterium]